MSAESQLMLNVNVQHEPQKKKPCRLCLKSQQLDELEDIFQSFENSTVAQYVNTFSNIQITKEDCFPKFICRLCFKKVKLLENFRQTISNSDQILKNALGVVNKNDKNKPVLFIVVPKKLLSTKKNTESKNTKSESTEPIIKTEKETNTTESENLKLIHEEDTTVDIEEHKLDVPELDVKSEITSNFSPAFDVNKIESVNGLKICNGIKFKEVCGYCKNCKIPVPASDEKEHICNNLPAQPVFVCDICDKICDRPYNLEIHKKTHIPKVKPTFKCQECGRDFSTKQTHKLHMEIHNADTNYQCEICGRVFRHLMTFSKHRSGHFLKRATCEICKKVLSSLKLKAHIQAHKDGIGGVCPTCGKIYKHRNSFKNHLKTHNKEWKYECKVCSKKYPFRNSLTYHMLSHTNAKKHSCEFCGKTFKHKSSWYLHGKIHARVNPFTCTMCNKKFGYPDHLKGHMKIIHGIIEEENDNAK